MDPDRWRRVACLYDSALEHEPESRAAFVAAQAGKDDGLRREVESLLAHDSVPVLLDHPMLETAAAVLDDADLTSGAMLGPYRIEALAGAGGMGQVYRATDTRLERTVAIKIVPNALASDPRFHARLHREARAIATLTHPHICTLYDIGHDNGIDFLVMEYLEGETLACRLQKGPLPVADALDLAGQIASALDAAHRRGIVHRDLKPNNVVLTRSGAKLLDFGLATPIPPAVVQGVHGAPSLPAEAAQTGTVLGTLQYMAPEQLEGKDADSRTDIFAFGVVLYEMLSGKKAFQGSSRASLIETIMHAEPPPLASTQSLIPAGLERVVKTCLAKDRDDRWQTARDLWRELEWVSETPTAQPAISAPSAVWTARRVAAAVVVAAVLAGYGAWTFKSPPSPSWPVTRFSATLPDDMRVRGGVSGRVAMSPDGSGFALLANDQVYLRSMSDDTFRPVPGTELSAGFPVFSPDGQWLAFWSGSDGGTLKKIPVNGGATSTIGALSTDFGTLYGASWGPGNQILVGAGPNGVQRVSADGGDPETIIRVNAGQLASNPQLLPDGDHVLFTLAQPAPEPDITRQRNWDQARIVVQSLKSGDRKVLVEGGYDGRYVPTGHVVYAFASTLWARRFDLSTLRVVGEPVSLVEGVSTHALGRYSTGTAEFAFSRDGSLVYLPADTRNAARSRSIAFIDLSGNVTPVDLPRASYHSPRFSLPDGKQLALYTTDGVIWIYDVSGEKSIRKLTETGGNLFPTWTRDGRVVFNSVVEGRRGLFWQRADGSAPPERLTQSSYFPYSVSPDGKTLVAAGTRTSLGQTIVTLPLPGDAPPTPVFQGGRGDVVYGPAISPDGRWLAYEWKHEEKNNVYVDPFPPTGVHHPVTTDGGSNPMWSPDGKRLFYIRQTQRAGVPDRWGFYAVDVLRTGASVEFGKHSELFSIADLFVRGSLAGNIVDLSPDGKRFVTLLVSPESGRSEQGQVHVVLNWFGELTNAFR